MLKVSLDSGGSHTVISEKCLPPGATPTSLDKGKQHFKTIAGDFVADRSVCCSDLVLPEFDKTG